MEHLLKQYIFSAGHTEISICDFIYGPGKHAIKLLSAASKLSLQSEQHICSDAFGWDYLFICNQQRDKGKVSEGGI